jgi:hypothetical protein
MNIESDIKRDPSDNNNWIITITGKINNDILFTFTPQDSGTSEDWNDLIIACQEDDINNYLSTPGADCQISVNNKHVFFELNTTNSGEGEGEGGEVEIMIGFQTYPPNDGTRVLNQVQHNVRRLY